MNDATPTIPEVSYEYALEVMPKNNAELVIAEAVVPVVAVSAFSITLAIDSLNDRQKYESIIEEVADPPQALIDASESQVDSIALGLFTTAFVVGSVLLMGGYKAYRNSKRFKKARQIKAQEMLSDANTEPTGEPQV